MDAFYAAVEVREDPSLAGRPVIIGHRGRRGVVSTCSYEARRFGVHSAMPSVIAERLCPGAVWLPGRMALYVEVSHGIRAILERHSPLVEPLSIDEAFLDLTGIARDLADGRRIAAAIKQEIRDRERLTGSAGVAPNKFLAKVASDLEKPDGLVVFPLEEVAVPPLAAPGRAPLGRRTEDGRAPPRAGPRDDRGPRPRARGAPRAAPRRGERGAPARSRARARRPRGGAGPRGEVHLRGADLRRGPHGAGRHRQGPPRAGRRGGARAARARASSPAPSTSRSGPATSRP